MSSLKWVSNNSVKHHSTPISSKGRSRSRGVSRPQTKKNLLLIRARYLQVSIRYMTILRKIKISWSIPEKSPLIHFSSAVISAGEPVSQYYRFISCNSLTSTKYPSSTKWSFPDFSGKFIRATNAKFNIITICMQWMSFRWAMSFWLRVILFNSLN